MTFCIIGTPFWLSLKGLTRISCIKMHIHLIAAARPNFMKIAPLYSRLVITDSGGIQEETTYLGIPCLTMRPNTERPITITKGTNQLCALKDLEAKVEALLTKEHERFDDIEFWDGMTASRIVEHIKSLQIT
jgi:UDP-N-acetylglucosamine 2-epimerase